MALRRDKHAFYRCMQHSRNPREYLHMNDISYDDLYKVILKCISRLLRNNAVFYRLAGEESGLNISEK